MTHMPGDPPPRAPFEEQAALAELERLQREIEESRRRRRQANDAFDKFLRSFGARPTAPVESPAPAASPAPVAPPAVRNELEGSKDEQQIQQPVATQEPVEAPKPVEAWSPDFAGLDEFPAEEFAAAPIIAEPSTESALLKEVPATFEPIVRGSARSTWQPLPPSRRVPAALTPGSRHLQHRPGLFVVGGIALAGVAFIAWRASHPVQSNGLAVATPAGPKPAPVVTPAPAAKPTPPPAPVPAAELTTTRRVWVRVLVDGEKAIEREVEANARIPLNAKQRIVLRAGDAGAVRLLLGGKDQGILGPDGIAVTRAFVISPAPPH